MKLRDDFLCHQRELRKQTNMIGFVAIVDILRERCMDLVSFESPEEYRHFALMMHRGE